MAKQIEMPNDNIVKLDTGEDSSQRPIKRLVDYIPTDKDKSEVAALEFTIEDFPDISYIKKGLFVVFSSSDGTSQTMFDGWCNLQLIDKKGNNSGNSPCYSGTNTCVNAIYCHTIRDGNLMGISNQNLNMANILGNTCSNTSYDNLLVPILDWFQINSQKNGGGLCGRTKIDMDDLDKIRLYGYKTTAFSNVGRIEIYGF